MIMTRVAALRLYVTCSTIGRALDNTLVCIVSLLALHTLWFRFTLPAQLASFDVHVIGVAWFQDCRCVLNIDLEAIGQLHGGTLRDTSLVRKLLKKAYKISFRVRFKW